MYAVIESGGKQHRVECGHIFQVEKLEGEVGAPVKFDQVLFLSKGNPESAQVWIGKPVVNGAQVETEIVGQGRGEKILIVKMKRRKQYRRTQGHRQEYTQLLVTGLSNGAGETITLSDADRKTRMSKFQSHLAPRGQAHTPKTLGSRKRLAATHSAAAKGGADTQEKTATAKKKPAAKNKKA